MPDLKELETQLKTTFESFKEKNDRLEAEVKKLGEGSAETKAHAEKANADLDRIEGEIKKMLTRMNRPAVTGDAKGEMSEAETKAREAFDTFLRKGSVGPDEAKALSASTDTAGGYLAPKEYVNEIIKTVTEFSPMRGAATVRSTSQRSIQIPKRTASFSAAWVAEQGTRTETTGLAYGLLDIPTHEMYALVDISQQMLEDSSFNLEQELAAEFAEQFAVAEATAFITGTGVGKPEGFTVNADIDYTPLGNASVITADGLIDLFFAVKDAYARSASWMVKRSTLAAIRKLKDGNGAYLWQPALAGSSPATILDRPYVEAVDMPAVAANALSIGFGDFRKGYTIVDRVMMSITRDGLTQATSGNVRFIARKRVGGQLVQPEAVRLGKIATT